MASSLIFDIVVIFTAALLGGFIADRLRQSPIVGYMLGGIIVGPHVLKMVNDVSLINELGEIGVILLMFTLGIEFSLSRLDKVKKVAIWGGILQIAGMILIGILAGRLLGFSFYESFFLGCVISISSTMIVMRSLSDAGDLNSIHGQIMLGILIVQDLSVIIMVSLLPLLKNFSPQNASLLALSMVKIVVFVIIIIILSRKLIPLIMNRAARSSNNEVFLLLALSLGLGVAAFSHQMGLSVSLGAFLAGLVVSESEYTHEILGKIVSFRDSFVVLFFVSVGMLVNPASLTSNWRASLLVLSIIILAKFLVVFAVVRLFKYHSRIAFYSGMGLLQTGEFSIVMAQLGLSANLINITLYDIILATSIISILLTPLFIELSPLLYSRLRKSKYLRFVFPEPDVGPFNTEAEGLNHHVILCGYGRVGRVVGQALQYMEIPYIVIEYDYLITSELSTSGIPFIYGDASNEIVLQHAACESASMVILSMPDIFSNQRAAKNLLVLNPGLTILSRAHKNWERDILLENGISEVVIPEAEAGIQMIWHIMMRLGLPLEKMESYLEYLLFRNYNNPTDMQNRELSALETYKVQEFSINAESPWADKTLRESGIRELTGCNVVSIRKPGGKISVNPRSIEYLNPGDRVIVLGTHAQLLHFSNLNEGSNNDVQPV